MIEKIRNPYPDKESYKRINDTITIFGKYYDENSIAIEIEKLDQLNYTPDTEFNFIIVFTKKDHNDVIYYTSEEYYKVLASAIKQNNPYISISESLKVEISIDQLYGALKELDKIDQSKFGLKRISNMGISDLNNIDYDILVKYIDWLVKKPEIAEDPLDTLKKTSKYAEFEYDEVLIDDREKLIDDREKEEDDTTEQRATSVINQGTGTTDPGLIRRDGRIEQN